MEPNQKDRPYRTTALKDAQPMANASSGSHSQIQSVDASALSTSHSTNNCKSDILSDAVPGATKLRLDSHIWNWHCKAVPNDPMPANFYEASLTPWSNFGSLQGDADCDVVVIGAGLLGASTALHMAEAGLDVVLVEKDDVGSGASGRNGGQLTPGLARWEADSLLQKMSIDEAKRVWRFVSEESMALIDSLSDRYGFDCDRKCGHLTAALHPGHMGALVANADARRKLGDTSVKIIGPLELKEEHLRSHLYHGAALDNLGGQAHPLALLRGLVKSFIDLGGRVYDRTAVADIRVASGNVSVVTSEGSLRPRRAVVLAVNYATPKILPGSSTTLPFYTYVSVTPPLAMDLRDLLPTDMAVNDTQLQIDYYRAIRGNRLLFGGQGTGHCWSPKNVNKYLLKRIATVFPQIDQPALEYSWGGITDLTLNGAIDARKSEDRVPLYLVQGWSGHGVAQTVRIGKAISDDLTCRNDDYSMLTAISHSTIPFGRFLSPVVIPLAKGAMGARGLLNPGEMLSF